MDTMEEVLSMLLEGAVDTLDVSPELQQFAIERYKEVGTWLAEHGDYGTQIYPQGSFRLGTVVRPNTGSGEYDIDLVCQLLIAKENITQAQLKKEVGSLLQAYVQWKVRHGHSDGPKTCEARRRCWMLTYPDHGFHLDVLPAIPDVEYPSTGILLTDKQLYRWQHSNPIGYAKWFRTRSEELQKKLITAAEERRINVDEVPEWEFRTALQRVVQVLKWHAMLFFADDEDIRPPSILITTLAARAYTGETDLFTATRRVLMGMDRHIENRHGIWWVPNPAHREENFADKWNEYPARRKAFIEWHRSISAALDDTVQLRGMGLQAVASRLEQSFGRDSIQKSVERYGERMRRHRTDGSLRMSRTGSLTTSVIGIPIRDHTFYGDHTHPGD
ncbi:MAG: nucleotidyltransferase [Mycobacterium sp.]|nr:nucleotidyltransferase [Mycobacterium sp.]